MRVSHTLTLPLIFSIPYAVARTRAIQRKQTLYPGIDTRRHIVGPSNHTSRIFVLCFDGTGDQFDADVRTSHALFGHRPFYVTVALEYKRRAILRSPQKGRWESTSGLLPGLFVWSRLTAVVSGVRPPQPGVGTFSVPQFVSPFRARAQKYLNMAIANHLNAHVMSTPPFLMRMYTWA